MGKEEAKPRPEEAELPRNFTITTAERLRALAAGAPAYARRRRRIEILEASLVRLLVELEVKAEAPLDVADLPAVVLRDLDQLNRLIEEHNRYYPIEANLRIDLRTRRLMDWGEPWEPMPRVTAAALLAAARGR